MTVEQEAQNRMSEMGEALPPRAELRHDFGPDVERLVGAATDTANAMSDAGPFAVAEDEALANA